jgi:hypothetical protein
MRPLQSANQIGKTMPIARLAYASRSIKVLADMAHDYARPQETGAEQVVQWLSVEKSGAKV